MRGEGEKVMINANFVINNKSMQRCWLSLFLCVCFEKLFAVIIRHIILYECEPSCEYSPNSPNKSCASTTDNSDDLSVKVNGNLITSMKFGNAQAARPRTLRWRCEWRRQTIHVISTITIVTEQQLILF